MKARPRNRRLWTWPILPFLLASLAPGVSLAQEAPPQIKLKKSFLRGLKFTVGDEKPANVYGFSGLSVQSKFKEVMSTHPPAMHEARKALAWNGVTLAGSLGLVTGSLLVLLDTISDAQAVSRDEFPDESLQTGPLALMVVSGVAMIVGAVNGGSHLKRGIDIFNHRDPLQGSRSEGDSSRLQGAGSFFDPARGPAAFRLGLGLRSPLRFGVRRADVTPQPAVMMVLAF